MDYSATIKVPADPATAARAVGADLEQWWSTRIDRRKGGFTIHFNNSHVTFAYDPDAGPDGFSWTCTDAHMIIEGVEDAAEWQGTRLVWALEPQGKGTRITLTHQGLTPEIDCHRVCVAGWGHFFEQSLRDHLNGLPGSPERSGAVA